MFAVFAVLTVLLAVIGGWVTSLVVDEYLTARAERARMARIVAYLADPATPRARLTPMAPEPSGRTTFAQRPLPRF